MLAAMGRAPNSCRLDRTQTDCISIQPGQVPLIEVKWIGTGCYSITRAAAMHMIDTYGALFAQGTKANGTCGRVPPHSSNAVRKDRYYLLNPRETLNNREPFVPAVSHNPHHSGCFWLRSKRMGPLG
jgi:hypothetical protein